MDVQQLSRIADRYIDILRQYEVDIDNERELRINVKLKLAEWHGREPLNLEILEHFPTIDFLHDIGGIMRDDTLMSARSALAYHPNQ